jgi:uncharacterized protein YceK
MAHRLITQLVFALSPLLCGCASYLNTLQHPDWHGERNVYGGTMADCFIITGVAKACFTEGIPHPLLAAVGVTIATIDLPLSVIGDTLTLPITLNHTPDSKAPDSPKLPDLPVLSDSLPRP